MKKRQLGDRRVSWNILIYNHMEPSIEDGLNAWGRWYENLEVNLDPPVQLPDGAYPIRLTIQEKNYKASYICEHGAIIKDGKFDIMPMLDRLDQAQAIIDGGNEDYIFIDAIRWDDDLKMFVVRLKSE